MVSNKVCRVHYVGAWHPVWQWVRNCMSRPLYPPCTGPKAKPLSRAVSAGTDWVSPRAVAGLLDVTCESLSCLSRRPGSPPSGRPRTRDPLTLMHMRGRRAESYMEDAEPKAKPSPYPVPQQSNGRAQCCNRYAVQYMYTVYRVP